MKKLSKYLILGIFLIPFISHAETHITCITGNQNYDLNNNISDFNFTDSGSTSGFTGLTDYSYTSSFSANSNPVNIVGTQLQNGNGNIDCTSFKDNNYTGYSISIDRSSIVFYNHAYWDAYAFLGGVINAISTTQFTNIFSGTVIPPSGSGDFPRYTCTEINGCGGASDGYYEGFIQEQYNGVAGNDLIKVEFYIINDKFYLSLSDVPAESGGTTTSDKTMTPTDLVMLIFLAYATIWGIVAIYNKLT